AGKTGTTQDASDIWYVGFTPEIVGAVWIGFDRRQTVLRGATGGELAAPLWGRVMRSVAPESSDWEAPPGIVTRTVNEHGEVIAENCPVMGDTRREYFLAGTAPIGTCYPDSYWAYADSFGWRGYDATRDTLADDDAWWRRLRQRVRRWRDRDDTLSVDPRARTDTTFDPRRRWPTDSLRRDTLRRDTTRWPPPDTTRRSPPDTIRRPPPDTTRWPPPDTMRRSPPDTIRRPPPDTTRRPPPDTMRQSPPDSVRRPPPDTTMRPPPDTTRRPPPDTIVRQPESSRIR
ncbi:MAG: hypothetical protein ACRELX_03330, partial [Longimicrobiales bacterium]